MKDTLISAAPGLRTSVIFVGLYLIVHWLFGNMTADDGLLTPEGAVNIWVALMGIWVLLMRLTIVCVLPSLIAFRIARWIMKRWLRT